MMERPVFVTNVSIVIAPLSKAGLVSVRNALAWAVQEASSVGWQAMAIYWHSPPSALGKHPLSTCKLNGIDDEDYIEANGGCELASVADVAVDKILYIATMMSALIDEVLARSPSAGGLGFMKKLIEVR